MQEYILGECEYVSVESVGQTITERKQSDTRLTLLLLLEPQKRLKYFCFPKLTEAESCKAKEDALFQIQGYFYEYICKIEDTVPCCVTYSLLKIERNRPYL